MLYEEVWKKERQEPTVPKLTLNRLRLSFQHRDVKYKELPLRDPALYINYCHYSHSFRSRLDGVSTCVDGGSVPAAKTHASEFASLYKYGNEQIYSANMCRQVNILTDQTKSPAGARATNYTCAMFLRKEEKLDVTE